MEQATQAQTGGKRPRAQGVYEKDLDDLLRRLAIGANEQALGKLDFLGERLKELRERNMLKINHSVLELVVAKALIDGGYEVDLEHTLDSGLTCDVHATKGMGTMIVEVETGYVPPSHALDPCDYIRARIASKIARYSGYCNKFGLAAPPHYIMPIPRTLIRPARMREQGEVARIKRYCDSYYSNPPVSMEEIQNAHVHTVMVIDVETESVREIEPMAYINRAEEWYR
jgi:hypothetical protein